MKAVLRSSLLSTPPSRALRRAAGLLWVAIALGAGPARAQQAPTIVEKTLHYSVVVEGKGSAYEAEAKELGVVLEKVWKSYSELLHGDPAQLKTSQITVRVCANYAAWVAAIETAGITPPAGLDSLYFQPERDTLFVCRQPSHWFTRWLALHGAWQQLHYRAKSKHADMVNTWFVLGLASQLSQHRWDGNTLELAAHPRISAIDLPGQAAKALEGGIGLEIFSEAGLRQPVLAWALVAFLRESKGGQYSARFDKLALGQTGSKLTGPEFATTLGKPEMVYAELQTWLASVQEPLVSVCGDWEDLDGRTITGRAYADDFAFGVIRAPASEVHARFEELGQSSAGVLLAFKDKHHYTFAVHCDRGIVVQRCDGSALSMLGEYQEMPSKDGTRRMHARRVGGKVTLFVEDRETASFELEGMQLGFAVEKGMARFLELSWK